MLLTRVQAYILDLLCKLKCMKTSQLNWFLSRCYSLTEEQTEQLLRQLRYMGKIQFSGEYISLCGRKRDCELIAAVDIMLEFCDKSPPSFAVGIPPCKLVFFTPAQDEKVNVFKLFYVNLGQELLLSIEAQRQNQPPDHTVLFFVQNKTQIPLLETAQNAYYILKNSDGRYEFYR